MKAREKKLLIGFAAVVGVIVISRLAPNLGSAFDYTRRIADAREELEDLEKIQSQFQDDQALYAEYVARTGGTDADAVQAEVKPRIDALMLGCSLDRARVAPKIIEDPKTKIAAVKFSVTAEGTWANALRFVRDLYELPGVAQCTSLKLSPATKRLREDRVKIDVDVEVTVLPRMKAAGAIETGDPPDAIIKHNDPNLLAMAEPFWPPVAEPVPPPPPPVGPGDDDQGPPPPPEIRDPLRHEKFITMAWTYGRGEVTIASRVNTTLREVKYVGDDLDGGSIILVHPLGAVTRRDNGAEEFYPTGERLADCVPVEVATAYPEILIGVENLRALEDPVGPPASSTDGIAEDADDESDRGLEPQPADPPDDEEYPMDAGTNGMDEMNTNGPDGPAETTPAVTGADEGVGSPFARWMGTAGPTARGEGVVRSASA
ncbi:MAG: hypothetical protein JXB13_02510 [Phycisphaerae bacterium]|nr:hypothetical protein [Phycisphaerae bacterium]